MALSGIDCEQVLQEIDLYLDDELDESECRQIEAHLSDCADCLSRTEFRRKLQSLIARKCGREAVPSSLYERIRQVLDSERT